ncbi:MAG: hypothetical protein ACLS3J_02835 [Segatella copri]
MTGQKIYLFIDGYNHLANQIHANKEHKFGMVTIDEPTRATPVL